MKKGISITVNNFDELNEVIATMNPHNSVINVSDKLPFPQNIVVIKGDAGYDRISIDEYKALRKDRSIGVGIIVCGDTEHLEAICRAWCSVCDKLVVSYQKTSFDGIEVADDGLEYLKKLVKDGIIDNLTEYIPDGKPPRDQEVAKRNQLVSILQVMGCNWSHIQDADEYYAAEDLHNVCDAVIDSGAESTYCRFVEYYKDKSHILNYSIGGPRVVMLVPFLFKSNLRFGGDSFFNAPLAVDPTRIIDSSIDPFIFDSKILMMHHFAYIRKDGLSGKYAIWTAASFFEDGFFESVIKCHDEFDGTQDFVTIPKIAWKNKVKVELV